MAGKVIATAAMSLDGFIADRSDAVGPLFDWYSNGDVAVAAGDPARVFRTTAVTADYLRPAFASTGAVVIGRPLRPDRRLGWPPGRGRGGVRGDP